MNDTRHMVHNMYVDNLLRSFNAKPVVDHGIAMPVVGDNSSDVRCNYCKGVRQVTQDCAEKEHRRGAN